jgi:hypothetical protein
LTRHYTRRIPASDSELLFGEGTNPTFYLLYVYQMPFRIRYEGSG